MRERKPKAKTQKTSDKAEVPAPQQQESLPPPEKNDSKQAPENPKKKEEEEKEPVKGLRIGACLAVIVGIVWAVYSNALGGAFCFDDEYAVVLNRDVLPSTSPSHVWQDDFWGNNITSKGSHKSYRPLCVLSFRADRVLGDWWYNTTTEKAVPAHYSALYHTSNVAHYTVACALVFAFGLRATGGDVLASLLGTCLFAAHPIHTEAVTGIVGRAEILCVILMVLALEAYVRAARPKATRWHWMLVSMALVVAATLTKETGLTTVGVLATYDLLYVSEAAITSFADIFRSFAKKKRSVVQFALRFAVILATMFGFMMFRFRING